MLVLSNHVREWLSGECLFETPGFCSGSMLYVSWQLSAAKQSSPGIDNKKNIDEYLNAPMYLL